MFLFGNFRTTLIIFDEAIAVWWPSYIRVCGIEKISYYFTSWMC